MRCSACPATRNPRMSCWCCIDETVGDCTASVHPMLSSQPARASLGQVCHAMMTIAASKPTPRLHTCKLAFPRPEDFRQACSKHLLADSPTLTERWNSFACTCAQGLLDFASECSRATQRSHVHAAMLVSGGTPHPSAQFRVHQHL